MIKISTTLDEDLINEVIQHTSEKNISDAIRKALSSYIKHQKIKTLNQKVKKHPLKFTNSATKLRIINR